MGKHCETSRTTKLKKGTSVIWSDNGEDYPGTVKQCRRNGTALVHFEDGDRLIVPVDELVPSSDLEDNESSDATKQEYIGFCQYDVKWDHTKTHLTVDVGDFHFWGFWSRTRTIDEVDCWVIWLYARKGEHSYVLDSIPYYYDKDPRERQKSLDADICAAINKFIYRHEGNEEGHESIDDIRKRADHPAITIKSSATLDRIILDLTTVRDTALRCGGARQFRIESEFPGEPALTLNIDVTSTAMALDGKVPSLLHGAVFDGVAASKGKKGQKGAALQQTIDNTSLELLVKQYDKGNRVEQRRIRQLLRSRGIRGGIKSARSRIKKEQVNASDNEEVNDKEDGNNERNRRSRNAKGTGHKAKGSVPSRRRGRRSRH